ncbi:CBS and ACT domain-containing protein [Halodesulfovibrio sp.]|uniref:CBS and ACT domain-containing protein n=1 Tax=Halodesulfovibrio sp. TaxID=1912772 RepID=UPI0025B82874|nr:CBS and ACT domain-containing protein [Halodesulfovibrio sp.]
MLIRDWMAKDVITVSPDTSMMKASKALKAHDISRVPVVDHSGRVVGIVSDRDIKEASPSKATTLDVHELYYLLSEIKVKDIMTVDPLVTSPTNTVENAAMMMIEKDFGGLPVVDDDGKLVGIITVSDIFNVLISITGVRQGGVQFGIRLPNEAGTLRPILNVMRAHKARIVSILSSMEEEEGKGTRDVNIRIMPMERTKENQIIEELKSQFDVIFWARDNVHPQ